jgi:hypothetical protein
MTTIDEFCTKYGACKDGRQWAIANCQTMQEVWEKAKPEWLIWVATRKAVLTDSELRRFAVWSARQVQHLMTDPRSVATLDVAERYAEGAATDEEMAAARAAARAAVNSAASAEDYAAAYAEARAAAWAAVYDTAYDADWAEARAEAWAEDWAADWAAASDADWAAASDAARAAAWAAQAEWLRKNTTPNFN